VTSYYGDSKLEQYFTLYKDSLKVAVKCRINFKEKYKILKFTFPMNIENPEAVYSMPFGFIKKTPDGLEEPAQKWIFVNGDNGGVALINNGRYSFCVKDNEMRMIAARTCAFLDHFGQRYRDDEISFIDMDELEFEYALIPHGKDDFTQVVKDAELLNKPIVNFEYMEACFADKLATGKFAMGSR
jgi:alpha-mannosidase